MEVGISLFIGFICVYFVFRFFMITVNWLLSEGCFHERISEKLQGEIKAGGNRHIVFRYYGNRICGGAVETQSSNPPMSFKMEGVTVEARRPDWEQKLSPGTVTVIRPEQYKGEQKSLPDLLKNVPGVHVREVNGKGQYTTVTVRGSTAAQVGVFVDGVLSNLGGDAAVDISTIPVKNVERIEVYRGYIPARFGGTFIGGVINVVTKKPKKANISAAIC